MSKKEKKYIAIVFGILLIVGLFAVPGYGINVDENTEIDIARMDLKEYVRLFFGEGSRLFQYMDGLIGDLMDSVEIDHGEAPLYPIVAVVSVLRAIGRTDLGMYAYHYYLYVWFLFGIFAMYQVGKFLTGKIRFGVIAAAMIGLNPLLFGLSFINNKDMIMMSLTAICVYLGIQFVGKKTWKWSVLWAISVAFCINMRIIGVTYAGLFGLLYLYEFFTIEKKDKRVFWNGVLAIVVMTVVFIAITPATWYSLPGYFIYTITSSASFLRWHGYELYCGELCRYLENSLPWHYFLVCFAIRTPIVFAATMAAGQIGCVYLFLTRLKENWNKLKYMLIFMLIIWGPMLFFMIRGSNVTFRHFFFLYPELVFVAVYVLDSLYNKKSEKVIHGCIALQMFVCVVLIIVGHPFQTTYFSLLAGSNVENKYEYENTDYYKEALEEILRMDGSEQIMISSDNINCYFGIKQAWEILNPEKKARIQIAEPETDECAVADYHVYGESTLIKENMQISQGMLDDKLYEPEKKYNSQVGLDAYGNRVVTIFYNK